MLEGTRSPALENRRLWRGLLATLLLSTITLRLIFLGWFSSLDLAQDEAHYWDWSRNLDWSYYSKGPLIAWLIRASVELFGVLSIALTGNEVMAIRLPAVLCGALLLLSLYVLSLQVFRSERLAFLTVCFTAAAPVISACSILATIDSPFLCIWGWALVAGHRAVFRDEHWAWAATGLLVGFGILAKYTMALWLLSLGLFLLFQHDYRGVLLRGRFWVMVTIASLSVVPILIWNANNDWVSFRHVAGQAGVPMANRNDGIRWLGPLEYVGGQFALLLGYWFVAWIGAMLVFRPSRNFDPGIRYLWWMSAPTFAIFGAVSIKSAGQLNWPVAAYLSGIVLASAWLAREMSSANTAYRRFTRIGVGLACGIGLLLTLITHDTRIVRPFLADMARMMKKDDPLAARRLDPTCRMRGWKYLGGELDELRQRVRNPDGTEALIAGQSWNLPGEIGFYCLGHPAVYSLGPFFGDRHSQYDLWRPNPIADVESFAGKTFLVISDHEPTLRSVFAEVTPAKDVIYREAGIVVALWKIWICREYRGASASRNDNY